MKDSEFIELLNLYLDHEISAADAARLEAEVQTHAAHRAMYQNYCRMQKACKILAHDFGTESDAETDRKVVPFANEAAPRRAGWYAATTLAAAAACVALVFVTHHRQADTTVPAATSRQVVAVQPVAVSPHRGLAHGNASDLSLQHSEQNLALATAVQNDPHFSWMQDVRLTPLQVASGDQLRLAVQTPRVETPAPATGNTTLPADVHWVAVQFQK